MGNLKETAGVAGAFMGNSVSHDNQACSMRQSVTAGFDRYQGTADKSRSELICGRRSDENPTGTSGYFLALRYR
ncbi:hypothetical protein H097_13568 [Pseudomonas sp. FH4]|jgi:hypothetical protein|nr:hypothetical protein H097_13568 [Pseudomonas sp. FH4]